MKHNVTPNIDTFKETIISLEAGAKHVSTISRTRRNKRILLRWSNRGVSGVKLPTIRIGGELYTSEEALNWFLNASREAKRVKHSHATSVGIANSKAINEEAEDLGI